MSSPDPVRRTARRLFRIVLGLLLLETLVLVADRRIPVGHETWTRFGLQFTFLNGAAQDGTIPLWLPYAAQGTPSAWAWFEQGTFLQQGLLPAAPLLRGAGFLPLFHLGMLLEELLLLVGVWLLASKLLRSPAAAFFVSVAAVGSSLGMDHAAQNLGTISALPLALYLVHEVRETPSWAKTMLLGLLLVVQALGKPPAFALLVPGAALLYAAGAARFPGGPLRRAATALPRTWADRLRAAAAPALLVLLLGVGAFAGTGNLVYARPEGRFSGAALVSGAGLENPLQYLDFALGLSPSLDATCFSGYLTLGFALLALFRLGLPSSLRLLAFLFGGLLVLSALTLAWAALLPLPFPARAPTEGVPLVRLFFAFLAGFGFRGLIEDRPGGAGPARRTALILAAVCVVQGLQMAGALARHAPTETLALLMTFRSPPEAVLPPGQGASVFVEQAGMAALLSGIAAGILLLWSSGPRSAPLALGLALLVHPLDVFGWRSRTDWLKTSRLDPGGVEALRLSGLPFSPRRVAERARAPRSELLRAKPPVFTGLDPSRYGADSWLNESLWFADLPASRAPARYWSDSLERLQSALPRPPGAPDPWSSTAGGRLAGLTRDKVRFFSRSHPAGAETIRTALSRPEFSGDLLFVEGPPEEAPPPSDGDEHLELPYEVTGFTSDSLRLTVAVGAGGAWMGLAEAWHPSWTATANGASAPLLRANLGYQAVRLEQGQNQVELRFRSPMRTGVSAAVGLLAAAGIALLLRTVGVLAAGGGA